MREIFPYVVLGMYVPIIALTGIACALYVFKVLWPSIREKYFHFESHAIALAVIFSLGAHFSENTYNGLMRAQNKLYQMLYTMYPLLGAVKLMVMIAAILAITVYSKSTTGVSHVKKIMVVTTVLWVIGALAFLYLGVMR